MIADEGVEEYVVSRNGGRDTPRDEATVFYDRIRAEDFPPTEPHATLDDDHDADELSTNGDVVIADEPVLDAQPPPPASAAGVIWHSQPRTDPTPEPEATGPDDGERGEPVAIQDESPTVELRALSIEEAEAVEPEPEQATEPEVPEPEAGEAPETTAEPETANAPEPEARKAPETAAEPGTVNAPEPEARKAPETTTEPETAEVAEPSPEPIKAQSIQWPPRKPAAVEPAAVEPAAERVVEPAAAEPRA
ncbi:MAG TPA: hypothetical protein VG295_11655, partial [Solirubrobacteraceae bacterium]|nr:hypothetical protein [Solirubrobacteraceae bacterium]